MQVRFFGVRGSVPTPGSATVRYGGNTVCVEARLADGTILIFDGGTGIGMAIVYRIVQDHGGRLRVDSRPGAGTTITVELPTVAASVTLVSAEAPA